MNKYVEAALAGYNAATQDLKNYVRENTDFAVDLGLKCHMQAEILKKLLGKCAVVAEASLHAYKAGKSEAAYE